MTTDANLIRATRYAEIGELLQRDASLLIDRWARRTVQEQPNAARVHHSALRDHLPGFLVELGTHLGVEATPLNNGHARSAGQHGEQRWEVGWSLREVIQDYRVLRLVVLDYLDETLERALTMRETQAIGLALDEAIEASVAHYVASRDEEVQRLEESLRAADRQKDEFVATLAHELRNPLAPLRNAIEVFRLSDLPTNLEPTRAVMLHQVHQMTRLVDDLLDVAQIAQGKVQLRKTPIDLRHSLEQAVQMNAPLCQARRHRLVVELPPTPLPINGDPTRLVQIAVNLLNNAAKYTQEGGEISLRGEREGEEVVVRVKDNGIGIPPERLSHIFEMFTQLDLGNRRDPEMRAPGGLGIGLTLVRRLVELHGGKIEARSEGASRGSEFEFRLPALPGEMPEARPEPATPVEEPGCHILIVEDNDDGRESLATLLSLLGHRVEVAEDGPRGVQAALTSRPQIALVDLGLPGIDGFEVARRVRQELGDGIHLVALTGHSEPELRQKAIEVGFRAHLTKPVEPDALRSLLAELAKADRSGG